MEFGVKRLAAMFPDLWRNAINSGCLATFQLLDGFGGLFQWRQLIKLLLDWLLEDVDNCLFVNNTISAEESLEMLRPAVQNGSLVCQKRLSV